MTDIEEDEKTVKQHWQEFCAMSLFEKMIVLVICVPLVLTCVTIGLCVGAGILLGTTYGIIFLGHDLLGWEMVPDWYHVWRGTLALWLSLILVRRVGRAWRGRYK